MPVLTYRLLFLFFVKIKYVQSLVEIAIPQRPIVKDWASKCNVMIRMLVSRSLRGGHRHLQIGRMLDIDLTSESPPAPSPQMYVSKVWESVWPEGQEAIHS